MLESVSQTRINTTFCLMTDVEALYQRHARRPLWQAPVCADRRKWHEGPLLGPELRCQLTHCCQRSHRPTTRQPDCLLPVGH